MQTLLAFSLSLTAILPGLSLHGFFWLLGRTSRPHQLLGVFRSTLQMLATVTSPVKIALTVMVLFCAFAVDSVRMPRGTGPVLISVIGLVSSLQLALVSRGASLDVATALPSAAATLLSFSWSSRLWAETALD